jgi:hypothetical protein
VAVGSHSGIQNVSVNRILTVTEPFPLAPLITLHPQSQTVGFGAKITFSIQATGASPRTYQWRFDGADIIGATSSALTLNGALICSSPMRMKKTFSTTTTVMGHLPE